MSARAPWVGAACGAAVSAAAASAPVPAAVPLFCLLVGLPWSLGLWALGAAWVTVRGVDGVPAALFYLMPVAAGGAWGWVWRHVRRA